MEDNLNSVLFEGKVSGPPEKKLFRNGVMLVTFVLTSVRFFTRRDGRRDMERTSTTVQCWGQLGQKVLDSIRDGMQVRVLGRLAEMGRIAEDGTTSPSIGIVAEHVEVKRIQDATAG